MEYGEAADDIPTTHAYREYNQDLPWQFRLNLASRRNLKRNLKRNEHVAMASDASQALEIL